MIRTQSLSKVNNLLCSYIESKYKNIKNNEISAFMNGKQVKKFYQDMIDETKFLQKQNSNFQKKTIQQSKQHRKKKSNLTRIIKWDPSPEYQMNTDLNFCLRDKNKLRKRSKTSTNVNLEPPSYEMIQDIKMIKQEEQQKFIKKFYRNRRKTRQDMREINLKHKMNSQNIKYSIHIKNRDVWRQVLHKASSKPKTIEVQEEENSNKKKIMDEIHKYFLHKNRYPISNI